MGGKMTDPFKIRLTDDAGTLAFAEQLWQRFCEDLMTDSVKARVRLISGVQIAIRDAIECGETDALFYEPASHAETDPHG
jgi:hypothetical protein